MMSPREINERLHEQDATNYQLREAVIDTNRSLAKLAGNVTSLIELMQDQARRLDAQAQQIEALQGTGQDAAAVPHHAAEGAAMNLNQLLDQYDIDKSRVDEKYADLIALHVEETLKPYIGELTYVKFSQNGYLQANGEDWYEFDPHGGALSRQIYALGDALVAADIDEGVQRYLANRLIFPKETQ